MKFIPMMRAIFFASLLCTTTALFSQTSFTDAKANPDSASHYLKKGLEEKERGRLLESLKNFEKADKFDGSNKEIIANLATTYQEMRKYNQSLAMYKKLLALGDESAANYKMLLNLSFQLKQHDDVLLYAGKLKKADPSEKISFYMGKVQYEKENYGEAIKNLTEASKEDPENAEIPYMIARSFADMMNYKQAVPYFKKAIELAPAQNYWIYELGLIFYAMNNDKEALKYILEAGEKGYKKDMDYMENLGIAYLNVGNLDEGVNILNEILKRKPSDMNILNMVAEAYYYKGKYQQAMEYWDRVLEYDRENASSLYMIGMCYQKIGGKENTQKGIALCDRAIAIDPSLAANKQKKMMTGL